LILFQKADLNPKIKIKRKTKNRNTTKSRLDDKEEVENITNKMKETTISNKGKKSIVVDKKTDAKKNSTDSKKNSTDSKKKTVDNKKDKSDVSGSSFSDD